MCTLLIYVDQKTHNFIAAKTVDTSPTQLSFQRLITLRRSRLIAFQMGWQQGINSGMNEHGLVIMSSYMGWVKSSDLKGQPDYNHDTRGLANLETLDRYRSTNDAMIGLYNFFKSNPSSVGGIHFLLDKDGVAGILEHNEGQIKWKIYNAHDWDNVLSLVRANNPEFIHDYETDLDHVQIKDRTDRIKQTISQISHFPHENLMNGLKILLSDRTANEDGNGQIYIKNYINNGERNIEHGLISTETALIFDSWKKEFCYLDGTPENGKWQSLTFH